MNFYPITTNDGTISLFNLEVNDVYHSKIGAYTESLHKYVIPSGVTEFAKCSDVVKILDICYGLGYNSKTAVNEIRKINPQTQIHVTALEIDPIVVAFSTLAGYENYNKAVDYILSEEIDKQINIQQTIEEYIILYSSSETQIQNKIPNNYTNIPTDKIRSSLHNIYYRSISTRKSIDTKPHQVNINAEFLINDARKSVQTLDCLYDFIFLDPFTPSKAPALWTVEFFKQLYNHLTPNGNITTYSNAAPIRSGLQEAGFYLGTTDPIGKKTTGTIAYKNSSLVQNLLSEKEAGILKTKAGIPYRDETLSMSNEKILLNREIKKQNSNRISSGKFLKSCYTK